MIEIFDEEKKVCLKKKFYTLLERSIKSNISKQVWDIIKLVIIGIVFYVIKVVFNIKLN